MLDIMANSDFSHYDLVAAKLDSTGKVLQTKGFKGNELNLGKRLLFRIKDHIYFIGTDNEKTTLLKLDTNLSLVKSIRLNGIRIGNLAFSDTASLIFATSDDSNITAFDADLNVIRSVNYRDTLNRKLQFREITSRNGLVYANFISPSTVLDAVKVGIATFDFGLQEVRSRIFPNESSSYLEAFNFRNDDALSFLDFTRVLSRIFVDGSSSCLYNLSTDTLYPFKLVFPPNPLHDTLPINQTQESNDISLNRKDVSGNFYYSHYRIYDSDEFRNEYFVGTVNPLNGKIINYRSRDVLIRPQRVNIPAEGKFSLWGVKYPAPNFYGTGFFNQIDLADSTNCLAFPDTFARIEWGPKFKMLPYRLVATDTTLTVEDYPLTEFTVKLCEFDFCNPPSFTGLGPDIQTCADSVLLQGRVVYPGQKLEWSTGDTTISVKVKVGNVYSIKISGICGTFEDTIKILPKSTVEVAFSSDTLTTCKSVLLQPTAQQWISPRWYTPKGEVLNQQQLVADTSGYYIIQNDAGDCARRDTIYIDLQPVARPDLQLPDTVTTCKDLFLVPQASQWSNPVWQTPNGFVSGQIDLTTTLSGKYAIQNNVLGCSAKDSVFINRKSASTVSFFNQPDTLFTCKSVLLSPFAQPFINTVWETPSGIFTNVNTFNASTSGKYKVTNDIGNCANSDSIYIAYRDTAEIGFVLRSGGKDVTDFNLTLKENQFPYLTDAFTQTQAVRYRWFLNGQLQNGINFSQEFRISEPGFYNIQLVTTSSDSCMGKAEKALVIQKLVLPTIEIPSLVTQNADQKNDLFQILQLPYYPDNELVIYNRWGKEVFKAKPYQNNWPPADLLEGTYFYRLVATGTTYQGWVEVIR